MSDNLFAYNTKTHIQIEAQWCGGCGIPYGLPEGFIAERKRDHKTWTCPNGCRRHYPKGPTEAERKLKAAEERIDGLRTRWLAERDQRNAAEREAAEAKAREVRLRWRVGNGVCPCCSRTFPGLAAHVATKHPEFLTHDLDALSQRQVELLAAIHRATEEADDAIVSFVDITAGGRLPTASVRALVRRGLLTQPAGYGAVALTETGWPLAEQARRIAEAAR